MNTIATFKPSGTNVMEPLSLAQGAMWPSFEQFRTQGNASLQQITSGRVGTLITKQGQYRILTENDFQHLYGLARDIERLRGGIRVVIATARAAKIHPDEATFEALMEAVMLMGELPALPLRDNFESLKPEGIEPDDASKEDEIDLDNIPRPLNSESTR
jgi:hypothetical protein